MSGKAEIDDRNSKKEVWKPIFFSSQWLNYCKKSSPFSSATTTLSFVLEGGDLVLFKCDFMIYIIFPSL